MAIGIGATSAPTSRLVAQHLIQTQPRILQGFIRLKHCYPHQVSVIVFVAQLMTSQRTCSQLHRLRPRLRINLFLLHTAPALLMNVMLPV